MRGRSNQFYGPQSPGIPSLAVPPALKLWQESIPLHPSGRSQGVVRRALLGAPEASTTGGPGLFRTRPLTMNAAQRFSIGGLRWTLSPFSTSVWHGGVAGRLACFPQAFDIAGGK